MEDVVRLDRHSRALSCVALVAAVACGARTQLTDLSENAGQLDSSGTDEIDGATPDDRDTGPESGLADVEAPFGDAPNGTGCPPDEISCTPPVWCLPEDGGVGVHGCCPHSCSAYETPCD
jgi:hypothetical protein